MRASFLSFQRVPILALPATADKVPVRLSRQRRKLLLFGTGCLTTAVLPLASVRAQTWALYRAPRDMSEVSELLRWRFPDVPSTSTAALAELIKADTRVVLIDTRAVDEFDISHLPGANHAETGETALTLVAGLQSDTRIITYCSIGYRSASVARALLKAGYRNTVNLDGSIFRWANENRTLAGSKASDGLVHPFDDNWGQLLAPARRAPLAR